MKHLNPKRIGNVIAAGMAWLVALMLLLPLGLSGLNSLGLGLSDFTLDLRTALLLPAGALLCGLFGWYCYAQSREYLVTGPQGIEKHGHGYVYRTGWDNLAGVGLLGVDLVSADPRAQVRQEQMMAALKEQASQGKFLARQAYSLAQRFPGLGTNQALGAIQGSRANQELGTTRDSRPVRVLGANRASFELGGAPEGLILHRPVTIEKQRWAWGIIDQTRFIDLSDYPHWRHTALGKELARYAPQIFYPQVIKRDA